MSSISDVQYLINAGIQKRQASLCPGGRYLQNALLAKEVINQYKSTYYLPPLESTSRTTSNDITRPTTVQFTEPGSPSGSPSISSSLSKKSSFMLQFDESSLSDVSFLNQSVSTANSTLNTARSSNTARAQSSRQRKRHKLARTKSQKQTIIDYDRTVSKMLNEYYTVASQQQQIEPVDSDDSSVFMANTMLDLINKLIKDIQDAGLASPSENTSASSDTVSPPKSNTASSNKAALSSPAHRLKAQKNRVTFEQWRAAITNEADVQDMIQIFVELRYFELKERQKDHFNEPTKLKAAVCAELLLKLCRSLGTHSAVIEQLLYELFNCIFDNYATHPRAFTLNTSQEEFLSMGLYLNGYLDKCEQIEDLQQEIDWMKQGVRMKNIVKKFQCVRLVFDPATRFLRDTCFNMWKAMYTNIVSYKHVQIKKQLRYRFNIWTDFLRDKYVRIKAELRAHRTESMDSLDSWDDTFGSMSVDSGESQEERDVVVIPPLTLGVVSQMKYETAESLAQAAIEEELKNKINTVNVDVEPDSSPDSTESSSQQQQSLDESLSGLIDKQIASRPQTVDNSRPMTGNDDSRPRTVDSTTGEGGVADGQLSTIVSPAHGVLKTKPSKSFRRRNSVAQVEAHLTRKLSILHSERQNRISEVDAELMATLNSYNAKMKSASRDSRDSNEAHYDSPSNTESPFMSGVNTSRVVPSVIGSPTMKSSRKVSVQMTLKPPHGTRDNSLNISNNNGSNSSNTTRGSYSRGGHMEGSEALGKPSFYTQTRSKAPSVCTESQTPASWIGMSELEPNIIGLESLNRPRTLEGGDDNDDAVSIMSEDSSRPNLDFTPINSPVKMLRKEISGKGNKLLGGTASGGVNEKLPRKYIMAVREAEELIAYIYGSMFEDKDNKNKKKVDFADHNSLLNYTKALLISRYAIKRLASKLTRGLMKCCMLRRDASKRLLLFTQLCGISVVDTPADKSTPVSTVKFNKERFFLFLNMVDNLFDSDGTKLRMSMNCETQDIQRDTVIRFLPSIFPEIYRTDYELFAFIKFEVMNLQVTSIENNPDYDMQQQKISTDEVFLLLMDYVDLEANAQSHLTFPFTRIATTNNTTLDVKKLHLF